MFVIGLAALFGWILVQQQIATAVLASLLTLSSEPGVILLVINLALLLFGMIETWLDSETGLAMNAHPGPAWLARMPERFRFIDGGYEATWSDMLDIVESTCHAMDAVARLVGGSKRCWAAPRPGSATPGGNPSGRQVLRRRRRRAVAAP
ncbi:hypothetical protein [Bosea sp. RAC05]|jgi:hypothetical protein|uniref:hypothetical protein n=1 Tax=Bosea sp. RAC05 TaxID=1842539 RepID=UPI00083D7F47|nr:hypothetical protein [Bosea sp. RAC05]AOG03653.1 hypothetical protein BSY19_4429 [Bosea sp. RAC05]